MGNNSSKKNEDEKTQTEMFIKKQIFELCIKEFYETGKYQYNIFGKSYIIAIHNNGPGDNNAIYRLDEFIPPNITHSKPDSGDITYLWGSTLPTHSDGNDWLTRCYQEGVDTIIGDWFYIVINMDTVLNINTLDDIIEFENKYAISKMDDKTGKITKWKINWKDVAKQYPGGISIMVDIENFAAKWYYGWDVDSIVIWNNIPVEFIQKVNSVERSKILKYLDDNYEKIYEFDI